MTQQITPEIMLLIRLIIDNVIREIFNRIDNLTPEEIKVEIMKEEFRNKDLIARLEGH
jgi:ethanolamine ammonia-lyase large subunit